MRLLSLSLRGVTRFDQIASVDFDALGPGLISLVGTNGSGKTSYLESLPALLFGAFPSRPGSLYDHCNGKDAFIEATFEDDAGAELKLRLALDCDRKTAERYVFLDGKSVTTGRAAEFDAEVERRFGSRALFLASVFASQNKSGNFLLLKKSERKDLFTELLGLDSLSVLSERARSEMDTGERELGTRRAMVAQLLTELTGAQDAADDLALAEYGQVSAVEALATARADEQKAAAALDRARGAAARLRDLAAADLAAGTALDRAVAALREAEAVLPALDQQAEQRRRFLASTDPDAMRTRARERHDAALLKVTTRQGALEPLALPEADALAIRQANDLEIRKIESRKIEIQNGRTRLAELKGAAELAASTLKAAEWAVEAVRRRQGDELKRAEQDSQLLKHVPCAESDDWTRHDAQVDFQQVDLAGTCPLLGAAREAAGKLMALRSADPAFAESEAAEQAKAALALAIIEVDNCNTLLAGSSQEVADLDARARISRLQVQRCDGAAAARSELESLGLEALRHAADLKRDFQEADEAAAKKASELASIAEWLVGARETAESTLARCRAARREAEDAHVAAAQQHSEALAEAGGDPAARDRDLAEAQVWREAKERGVRAADQAVASAQARVNELASKRERLDGMERELDSMVQRVGDWKLLADALGRDGVQALEVDAAGPEVASITNELLAACYGPRFSITFETLREKTSRPGEYSEAFDVQVYDGGEVRPVEALSGGEKVVVGEAIGLAIAIFNCRKSGIRWKTFVRDETAGALDPENAMAYVQMLRRAREIAGAHQIVFVAHQEEVWQAADVQIFVDGGRISAGARDQVAA